MLDEAESNMNQSGQTELKCCCCCGRGKVSVSASFEKTKYVNGDEIRVIISTSNNTKLATNVQTYVNLVVTVSNGTRSKTFEVPCGTTKQILSPESPQGVSNQVAFNLEAQDRWPTCSGGILLKAKYVLAVCLYGTNLGCCSSQNSVFLSLPVFVGTKMSNESRAPVF